MFHTDEIRKASPFFWITVIGLGFWAAVFYTWPLWTAYFFAAASGVILSYAIGYRIRIQIKRLLAKRRAAELERQEERRETIRADLSAIGELDATMAKAFAVPADLNASGKIELPEDLDRASRRS